MPTTGSQLLPFFFLPLTMDIPITILNLDYGDMEVFDMLRSPSPLFPQYATMAHLLESGRHALALRAVEEGVVEPNLVVDYERRFVLMHFAAGTGPVSLLRLLTLKRDVDPSQRTVEGWSPLYIAIMKRQVEAAMFFIHEAPGVDLDASTRGGLTPLMQAVDQGLPGVVKALVLKGAQLELKCNQGLTTLMRAIERECEEVAIYLLEEAGAAWVGSGYDCVLVRTLSEPAAFLHPKRAREREREEERDACVNLSEIDRPVDLKKEKKKGQSADA
jgi:hypothetical protein